MISAVAFTFSSHSITLMPIDATATATAATVAVSASAFSMTTSHGLITKQTMVRILTLPSLLFKWDYESQTTYAAETSLIVATLRTQPTSKLIRCLVRTDRPVQCKLTCGCADRSGNTSILGSAAKRRHRAEAQTAAKNGSAVSQRVFPFVRVGFLSWFLVWFSFLVLDDAICVVGECEFLQRTVLGQHGAVSDDATLRGRGVIFLKPNFHSR